MNDQELEQHACLQEMGADILDWLTPMDGSFRIQKEQFIRLPWFHVAMQALVNG